MPVSNLVLPEPSRLTETVIWVSSVFRVTVALRAAIGLSTRFECGEQSPEKARYYKGMQRPNSLALWQVRHYPVALIASPDQPLCPCPAPAPFHQRVLDWFDQHGRKDLPWQRDTSPYRVWVSEIMLQQTQVKTVIPYFERFMQAFPDVQALARGDRGRGAAPVDGAGLLRPRPQPAQGGQAMCAMNCEGHFPDTLEGLCELPGIGRSTAGAILSASPADSRRVILDGNVKRVLARYHGGRGLARSSRRARAAVADRRAVHARLAQRAITPRP